MSHRILICNDFKYLFGVGVRVPLVIPSFPNPPTIPVLPKTLGGISTRPERIPPRLPLRAQKQQRIAPTCKGDPRDWNSRSQARAASLVGDG